MSIARDHSKNRKRKKIALKPILGALTLDPIGAEYTCTVRVHTDAADATVVGGEVVGDCAKEDTFHDAQADAPIVDAASWEALAPKHLLIDEDFDFHLLTSTGDKVKNINPSDGSVTGKSTTTLAIWRQGNRLYNTGIAFEKQTKAQLLAAIQTFDERYGVEERFRGLNTREDKGEVNEAALKARKDALATKIKI